MKYLIINLCGGIGNQLFQLANAHQLASKYKRQLLICDKISSRNSYWKNLLRNFTNNLVSEKEFLQLKMKSTVYNWAVRRFEYKDIILESQHQYYCIEGYYQSYKYFDINIFEPLLVFENNTINEKINSSSVALHIRRTDYLNNNFHKPISLNYYYNSLEQIISTLNGIIDLYIFSDDIEWCKKNFNYRSIIPNYVKLDTDIEELYMMSKFNNIIIANSSFSWWAAYLNNNNSSKQIFCPKNWFNNGCHLNTKDLRPNNWNVIDDDLPFKPVVFDKNKFNIISFGSACCMVQNIHDNMYNKLGPLYKQPENATNFFDWLITDFKFITYLFENLMVKDDNFLCLNNFTFQDVTASPQQLQGGWSNVYRKVEFKDKDIGSMISLHDVKKENNEIPIEFIEKYKRRFERLYDKIKNNDTIYLMHCFDFQWLQPYFPLVCEIEKIFTACKTINPICNIKLYFFIHPKYHDNPFLSDYKYINNVELCFLKDKGFHADWKANNLNFELFFL
ncbi:MAG: hypothetical protein CMI79_02320 [Candidatus Pelagibacter sp.]|nr:hypothetical protein [Candidatus Pelagibacter sp.]|tara:strand:+ start:3863 stop:5377 length:1515 start_codon:yes stop_codon:yes gene_type:complete